jgi:hypothetical protein
MDLEDDETVDDIEAISSGKANEEHATVPIAHDTISHEKNNPTTTPTSPSPSATETGDTEVELPSSATIGTVTPKVSADNTIDQSSTGDDEDEVEGTESERDYRDEETQVYEDSMDITGATTRMMVS